MSKQDYPAEFDCAYCKTRRSTARGVIKTVHSVTGVEKYYCNQDCYDIDHAGFPMSGPPAGQETP